MNPEKTTPDKEHSESNIHKRLRKIEDKLDSFVDSYEDIDNNISDLYDTINKLKSNSQQVPTTQPAHKLHPIRNSNRGHKRNDPDANDPDANDPDANDPDANDPDSHSAYYDDENYYSDLDTGKCKLGLNALIVSTICTNNPTLTTDQRLIVVENCFNFITKLYSDMSKMGDLDLLKPIIEYFGGLDLAKQYDYLSQITDIYNFKNVSTPNIYKILNSNLDVYHKHVALNKYNMLEKLPKDDAEYYKLSSWICNLLDIPFNKYEIPTYLTLTTLEDKSKYLQDARKCLDTVIFGQSKTKEHIVEIVGKLISANCGNGNASIGQTFAIYGEAGTGKTTLIKEGLSKILGLPFIFISLGGAVDSSYLSGHHYTYVGSCVGKIIDSLKLAKCMNPIFYFDELDKVSSTERGQEIINLLIHLTDYTQNSHFLDNYMDGISVDLSRATFIFSFNDKTRVSPILLDRMEIIKFHSYTLMQKIIIARRYLIPSIIKTYYPRGDIHVKFNRLVLVNIINKSKNGGVRYIKQKIEKLLARANVSLIKNETQPWLNIINRDNSQTHKDNDKINKIIIIKNYRL